MLLFRYVYIWFCLVKRDFIAQFYLVPSTVCNLQHLCVSPFRCRQTKSMINGRRFQVHTDSRWTLVPEKGAGCIASCMQCLMYACLCMYKFVCVFVWFMYAYLCVCFNVCICFCVYVSVCMYVFACIIMQKLSRNSRARRNQHVRICNQLLLANFSVVFWKFTTLSTISEEINIHSRNAFTAKHS